MQQRCWLFALWIGFSIPGLSPPRIAPIVGRTSAVNRISFLSFGSSFILGGQNLEPDAVLALLLWLEHLPVSRPVPTFQYFQVKPVVQIY